MLDVTDIKPEAVITSTTAGIQFGSWIPVLKSDGVIDIAIRNALYVKAEQLVTCTFDIIITGLSGGKNSSVITLDGLPHVGMASTIDATSAGSLVVSYFKTTNQDLRYITGTVKNNTTSVEMWTQKRNTNGLGPFVHLDINVNSVLTGFVTYITTR